MRKPGPVTMLLILLLAAGLRAQNFFPILGGQRVGTSVFPFLKIGVSARAVGMGEAVVALHQDASALYYNPGAIAQLSRNELLVTRVNWPAGIRYDFIGLTRNLRDRHYLGFSAGILHMEPMAETTEYQPRGTGRYFVFQDVVWGLTYGVRMTDRFSFGVTAKHVEENLAGIRMREWLIDMGTFYWTGFKSLRFSASLSHFGPQTGPEGTFLKRSLDKFSGRETSQTTRFEIFSPPTVFRVGSALELVQSSTQRLTVALQLNHPVDDAENVVMGLEYMFLQTLALRAGYKLNRDEENVSLGMGLFLPAGPVRLKMDLAYTNFIHLSDPLRISLGLSF